MKVLDFYPVFMIKRFRKENSIIDNNLVVASIEDYAGGIHHLNKTALEILSLFDGKNSVKDVLNYLMEKYDAPKHRLLAGIRSVLRNGIEKGFISLQEHIEPPVPLDDKRKIPKEPLHNFLYTPREVLFELTYACNLHCKHCYSSSGEPMPDELDKQELMRLADELGEMKVFRVSIGGGEPLLRIEELIFFVRELNSRGIEADLVTNGVLFNEEVARALWKAGLRRVQFSLDGVGTLHDEIRGFKGCFDKVVEAIKLAKLMGYKILVKSVVQRKNLPQLKRIYALVKELGVSYWSVNRFVPSGRAKEFLEEIYVVYENYAAAIKKIKDIVSREVGGPQVGLEPLLDEMKARKKKASETYAVCMAGTLSLHLCPDGTVLPCSYFPKEFSCGNIREQNLHNIWLNSKLLTRLRTLKLSDIGEPCTSCGLECNGKCRGSAAAFFGRITAPDPMCPIVERRSTEMPYKVYWTKPCAPSPAEEI